MAVRRAAPYIVSIDLCPATHGQAHCTAAAVMTSLPDQEATQDVVQVALQLSQEFILRLSKCLLKWRI